MNILYVALGGAIGASARHMLGGAALRVLGPGFPWGTLIANVFGGLMMGLLAGWMAEKGGNAQMRLFLAVGVLGGFTTFSAFSLDAVLLLEKRAYGAASLYIGGSVLLSIFALMAGLFIARKVLAP